MSHAHLLLFLLADLIIVIIAARGLGWLANRLGQPRVIGEIVAGILLGPTVLGRISPAAPQLLFPEQVPLRPIADLGLIFFMFLVGLELDARLMRKEGRRALQISLSGIIAPLLLGMLLARPLLEVNNGGTFLDAGAQPPQAFTFALFLGTAMCITAFPVLARILVETGLYKTAVGTAALCAAAVDDAIAWILLAAVVGIAKTGSPAEAVGTFVLALIFVAFMFTVGRRLLESLARRYDATGHLGVDQVAVVLTGVLLAAYTTERIGIHAIFGAFVFGACMPKRSGMTRELTDKVEDFTVVVLLPVFFVVTGLRTNLFALNNPALLGWLIAVLIVAMAGKFVGCGLAARVTGSSARDSVIVGALMNTRGLTELVILSIGLSLGVLSDRTFAMMVIMALVTTFIAAPIINRLTSRDELVHHLVGGSEVPRPVAIRVLVALGSPVNVAALVDAGVRLTGGRRPAELLLVRLIPTPRASEFRTGLLDEESQVAASVDAMRRLVALAATAGVSARPISFLSDDVGMDLARVAENEACDTILLGWHRASLERQVVRALIHRTFALSSRDVVVFVDQRGLGLQPAGGRPVLVALVGNEHDGAVADMGMRLVQGLGATGARLLGYLASPAGESSWASSASEDLALYADRLRRSSGQWVVPVYADRDALSVAIQESSGATAAVVGLGKSWLGDEDFGHSASELAEAADCPVFVVRAAGSVASGSEGLRQPIRGAAAAV